MTDSNASAHSPDSLARWRDAARIVDEVLELAEDARADHVQRACGGDALLLTVVERWLAATATPNAMFDQPAWPADVFESAFFRTSRRELSPGTRIGAWSIVRAIGAGGMGDVYEAERADGAFTRSVALKVVRSAATPAWFANRLQQERQLLARLDHPSIARLLDGGVLPDGTPFYAMELVRGGPIDVWCDAKRLDIPARLRLIRQVCHAVAYAHRQFVVHRDLKPSNILVTDDGLVKIVDFGIARFMGEPGELPTRREATPTTARHDTWAALTPAFASPEQFAGQATSAQSDVYSLTAVLFALLVGTSPNELFEVREQSGAIHEWPETPPLASDVIATNLVAAHTIAAARDTTPTRLRRQLAGDLDAVLQRGLARDPSRRYASVDALDQDLANLLHGRPVHARVTAWPRRALLFARRNATAVTAGALAVVGLIATTGIALRQSIRAEQSRQRVMAVNAFLLDVLSLPYPYDSGATRQVSMRTLLDSARARSADLVKAADTAGTDVLAALAKGYRGLGDYRTAADLTHEALTVSMRTRPSAVGDQAVYRQELAELRLRSGDATSARAELDTAERLSREAVGDSLTLAVLQQQRARTLRELGDLNDAERMVREAIAIFERVPGGTRRSPYANALQTLGHIQLDRGNYEGAEAQYRRTLAVRRNQSSGAIELANIQGDIAAAAMARGQLDEAEAMLNASYALKRAQLAADDPEVVDDDLKRAQLALYRGDFASAERQLRTARVHYARVGPIPPWRLASLLEGLATARLQQGDAAHAAVLADSGIAALAAVSLSPLPARAALLAVWANADEARNRPLDAARRRAQCREEFMSLRPSDPEGVRTACTYRYGRALPRP